MEYKNAKFIKSGLIDCEINHPKYGWIPFTCDPNDSGSFFDTTDLYARMQDDPDTAPYVPPTQDELDELKAQDVRLQRDIMLETEVDPIASNTLRWNSLTEAQRQAWTDYRQALLDITDQEGFPYNIIWPTKPE